jgi:hypothetical protein
MFLQLNWLQNSATIKNSRLSGHVANHVAKRAARVLDGEHWHTVAFKCTPMNLFNENKMPK